MDEDEIRHIRGNKIAMIFQEPMTSLNPVLTIGRQITETLELHLKMDKQAATQRAVELLEMVGIPEARSRINDYPHQFSGGMRQRVMIAMALSCNPKLLLADEPTTALDVTIQAQILELLTRLTRELGTAVIIITHNLGVVARYADRVNVMYAGKIVETATALELYHDAAAPVHPGPAEVGAAPGPGAQGEAGPDRGDAAGPGAHAAPAAPSGRAAASPWSAARKRCRRCCRWARTTTAPAGSGSAWPQSHEGAGARRERRQHGRRAGTQDAVRRPGRRHDRPMSTTSGCTSR